MKNLILVMSLALLCSAGFGQTKKESKGFLPKEYKKLYFGMSWEEFQKKKKTGMVEVDNIMSFRMVYTENPENSNIKEVTYYFDAEGSFPFYEIIIDYFNESIRDEAADNLFGSPNNGEEWLFERPESFDIKAWKFNNKLVIVGVLPGTEWEEGEISD
jgi:hypothetical protein